jgi:hypothetical protein
MAGYSGAPLPKKLGIQEGSRVVLVDAPRGFALRGVRSSTRLGTQHDVILLFSNSRSKLEQRFKKAARTLAPAGGLWIAWPKKASGVSTDLDENVVRQIGLAAGLVDNKVCAIDEIWSGLRFVIRLKDRKDTIR